MPMTTTSTTKIICDRDGTTTETSTPDAKLPPDWVLLSVSPTLKQLVLCPQCAAELQTFMKSAS